MRSFTELSIAVPAVANQTYDVWLFDNAGTLALELLAWTNDTTRATALTTQNGVLVKTGALTRRYIGSMHTLTASQTEDSLTKRLLYNYYNRVARPMARLETTATWTYSTDAYHQANAAVANQLAVVQGVAEDGIEVSVLSAYKNDQAINTVGAEVAVGEDSTTTTATGALFTTVPNPAANVDATVSGTLRKTPAVGFHTYVWLERVTAVGTTTWRGVNGTVGQSGITAMWRN
jgi:hypothetical protein